MLKRGSVIALLIGGSCLMLVGCDNDTSPIRDDSIELECFMGPLVVQMTPQSPAHGEFVEFAYTFHPLYDGYLEIRHHTQKLGWEDEDKVIYEQPIRDTLCWGCASSAQEPRGLFARSYHVPVEARKEVTIKWVVKFLNDGSYRFYPFVGYEWLVFRGDTVRKESSFVLEGTDTLLAAKIGLSTEFVVK